MPINAHRLDLALRRLEPTDWERFERLCHAFLTSEFGQLYRSTATPSGDGGRDAELFSPTGRSKIVMQFSVTPDWRSKINRTLGRLRETNRQITALIYVTNQEVGALADDLNRETRGKPLIDVRDRSWFKSRVNLDENRAQAAQALYDSIVAPTIDALPKHRLTDKLTTDESRTLLFFLELQHNDEQSGKGFTKSCFEALVRAALRDTSASHPITFSDICDRIARLLPQHDLKSQLEPYIRSAVTRLQKSVVKYNRGLDSYHLSHEEQDKLLDKTAEIEALRQGYLEDLGEIIASDSRIGEQDIVNVQIYFASVIELYLHQRGETFASAVVGAVDSSGDRSEPPNLMDDDHELLNAIHKAGNPPPLKTKENAASLCRSVVPAFLTTPSRKTLAYLKLLSDCYTLFSFLAATPDVQRATKKLFDHGEIWLDANVNLPLFAEWNNDAESTDAPFTMLFRQLQASGLRIYVSDGVLEELLSHLERCMRFSRASRWNEDVPYVAAQFLLKGGSIGAIPSFLEEFRGYHKPEDDIKEFLMDEFGIEWKQLNVADKVPNNVREEIVDYWQKVSDKRKRASADELLKFKMAKHDADNYLNIIVRRSQTDQGSWSGYTAWWLTLDGYAARLLNEMSKLTRDYIRHQPIMSLDFLTRYVTFGPIRTRIDRSGPNPLELYASNIAMNMPMDLIRSAQVIRLASKSLSERKKRRKITAMLDEQRSSYGEVHAGPISKVSDIIGGRHQ